MTNESKKQLKQSIWVGSLLYLASIGVASLFVVFVNPSFFFLVNLFIKNPARLFEIILTPFQVVGMILLISTVGIIDYPAASLPFWIGLITTIIVHFFVKKNKWDQRRWLIPVLFALAVLLEAIYGYFFTGSLI